MHDTAASQDTLLRIPGIHSDEGYTSESFHEFMAKVDESTTTVTVRNSSCKRKTMLLTSLLCLSSVAAAISPQLNADFSLARRQDSSLSLAASSQSIFLPWTSSFSRSSSTPPSIRGSIFGRLQTFLVDTSTTHVIVTASLVPDIKLTTQNPAGWEYLASKETLLIGRFATLDITFYSTTRNTRAVSRVSVLVATKAFKCPGYDESVDHGICPASKLRVKGTPRLNNVYLGVGFGRDDAGSDASLSTASHNAFLNVISINGANASSLRTGYTVSSRGVQLGLTPNNTAGAVWTPLRKLADPDPRAWALPQVSFTIDNSSEPVQAEALIDTSVTQMYIPSVPQVFLPNVAVNSAVQHVKAGTKLTFAFPDFKSGVAGYDFVVGDGGFPSQPSAVVPVDDRTTSFVNLGRNFLFGFEMLYDAVGGRFGLICARCV